MFSSRADQDLVLAPETNEAPGAHTVLKVIRVGHISIGHVQVEFFQKANILGAIAANTVVLTL